jgi:hypothetical protein
VRTEDTLLGVTRRAARRHGDPLSSGLKQRTTPRRRRRSSASAAAPTASSSSGTPSSSPVSTVTDGIFIAGACQYPKDIPDTVAQGAPPPRRAGARRQRDRGRSSRRSPTSTPRSARAATSACQSAPRGDPVQRGEGCRRGHRGRLQGLRRVRRGLRLGRPAAAGLHSTSRSSPRSKAQWPSEAGVRRRTQ